MSNEDYNWQTADWSREEPRRFWDPSRKLLKTIRQYQYYTNDNWFSLFKKKICVLRYFFWSVVTGADIPLNCSIGGGLLIPHPNGIVMHPDVVIGVNCLILQQVTLSGKVVLDYHVDIGAGAKLLGPLTVGHSSRVGANAVVTSDVEAETTVVGIPAKPLSYKK